MNNIRKLFDKTIFLKLDKKQKKYIGLILIVGIIWISIFLVRQINLLVTMFEYIFLKENNLSVLSFLKLFTPTMLNQFVLLLPISLGVDFYEYATEKDKSWRFSLENLFYCLAAKIILIIVNFLGG